MGSNPTLSASLRKHIVRYASFLFGSAQVLLGLEQGTLDSIKHFISTEGRGVVRIKQLVFAEGSKGGLPTREVGCEDGEAPNRCEGVKA